MDLGVKLPTQGLLAHDEDGNAVIQRLPVADIGRLLDVASLVEQLGFHSLWFPDHVVTERVTEDEFGHPANLSGKRAYPDRPNMLDGVVMMAAVVARTTTLRLAPSVYIAPYRHPLNSAHQLATLDVLSGGRLTVGIGVGWEKGEFDALGVSFPDRGAIVEESIEIYKLAWTEPWIEFHGRFFEIANVSMDPKPVQQPHPPIWYGGVTKAGALRAARLCDGFYPLFLDAKGAPDMWNHLREEIRREGDRLGRDLSGFKFGAYAAASIADGTRRNGRAPLNGTAGEVLEDLERFAACGYSHVTLNVNCPSGTIDELVEQLHRFAEEVLPAGRALEGAPLV